ncbi:hypothetical protein L1987_42064 [Smallanthus sonchifolius]|uniref:Uncharacterized protein n=1 Tax=Smallanthus sonchifolius TaxID=185202 RepID=A0ACB9GVK2_9ASTR|nr:hypothetical protein L1987_42064 [Smallanthus sonchifolius]
MSAETVADPNLKLNQSCWLKKQNDLLDPDWQEDGDYSIWMSGFNFGNVEAIVKMETKYGTLHIKLLAECSPHSFIYILELLASRHCVGCRFVRAEGHGESWDSNGNHMTLASFGPPFAILQGTLEAEGVAFKKIPLEACSSIRRGSVGWIGSGPEFFISLANHQEWTNTYTVFGYVLPDDMETVEKIATLPTVPDVWNNINVSVLETPVSFWFQRLNKATEET